MSETISFDFRGHLFPHNLIQLVRNFSVDAYSVVLFPENHRNFVFTQTDTAYWRSWFGETARNRNNQRFKKGFVEINF